MPAQATLLQFFKQSPQGKGKSLEPPKKRLKTDPEEVNSREECNSTFDEEQLERMENNKITALIRRQVKLTPALCENIGRSWFKALEPEFNKPYFVKLSEFLVSERSKSKVFPPENQVYSWSTHCAINEVKVVLLGQDPYHNPGQAHGLAFSVPTGVDPPPSLLNIFKELKSDIEGFEVPDHGNLTGWAQQGVLLLNAGLTVRAFCANSHKEAGWSHFTDAVIKCLSSQKQPIVFLLWGSFAQQKQSLIDTKVHHVLKCPHPSPLSAHRGFLGCAHFSKANQLLRKSGRKCINWSYLPK
ncbi:unnamed protein product [Darwinula stevensoni]|uniref:Uracil-DNA glycosylase n=1 Tax=Darwinula stevensoni TaxID=69355 RepID=A0A7R8XEY9_9CRUS|nr:unnamed protein product [Darwinula stevensoni]CAG0891096.1 unnamed protein product [Darwinula stevensoni]